MTSVLQNYSQNNTSIISGTQTVNFGNISCDGPVTIGNISQSQVVKINTSALSKSVTESTLSSILDNAVKQASDSNQDVKSGFLAITGGSAADLTKSYSETLHNVAASYTYNDFQNTLQQVNSMQSVGFGNISSRSYCDLSAGGGINQNLSFNLISKSIADKLSQTYLNLLNRSSTDQTSSSNQTVKANGPLEALGELFSGPIGMVIVALIAAAVFIAVVMIAYSLSGSKSNPYRGMPPPWMQPMPPVSQMIPRNMFDIGEPWHGPGSYGQPQQLREPNLGPGSYGSQPTY